MPQHYKIGMVVRIPVTKTRDAFAQVLSSPEIAVFDLFLAHGGCPSTSDIDAASLLFRIWVMHKAITCGRWPRVLLAALRQDFSHNVPRVKRDPISGQFATYLNGLECPARLGECVGLEPAAVWPAEHVERRLRDHLAGRPHKPLEMLLQGYP